MQGVDALRGLGGQRGLAGGVQVEQLAARMRPARGPDDAPGLTQAVENPASAPSAE